MTRFVTESRGIHHIPIKLLARSDSPIIDTTFRHLSHYDHGSIVHITYPQTLRGSSLWIYIISYFLKGIYLHKMMLHTMDGHWTQQDRKTERKPVDKWPNKGNSIQFYKTGF